LKTATVTYEANRSEDVVDQFHKMLYPTAWKTHYRGVPVIKNPLDLWIYQEIISEVKPKLIIETGTWKGGSALYLADLCNMLECGYVISIDVLQMDRPKHPRLGYLHGSSLTVPLDFQCCDKKPVLVILDSDHHKEHVRQEMERFAPLVTVGSYLIVEDTNIHGHPLEIFSEGDPMSAVMEFLEVHDEFAVDKSREKYMVTQNPNGFLRRVR
jgi:cephalosporin hydroxylase